MQIRNNLDLCLAAKTRIVQCRVPYIIISTLLVIMFIYSVNFRMYVYTIQYLLQDRAYLTLLRTYTAARSRHNNIIRLINIRAYWINRKKNIFFKNLSRREDTSTCSTAAVHGGTGPRVGTKTIFRLFSESGQHLKLWTVNKIVSNARLTFSFFFLNKRQLIRALMLNHQLYDTDIISIHF